MKKEGRLLLMLAMLPVCGGTQLTAQLDDAGFIDNRALEKNFARELGTLFEDKKLTPLAELTGQLKKAGACSLSLAKYPEQPALTPAALYARCRESVVVIGQIYKCDRCSEWHASLAGGFVIGRDGIIATNYHVIEGDEQSKALGVRTWDGRMLNVMEILAADQKNDLAILRVNADNLPPVPVTAEAQIGEPVYVISHPVEHFYTFSEGMISGKSMDDERGAPRRQITITADFAKGSSGCPVFNARGEVVGVVRATNATYYNKQKGVPSNIQMVWKYLVPGMELQALCSADSAEAIAP